MGQFLAIGLETVSSCRSIANVYYRIVMRFYRWRSAHRSYPSLEKERMERYFGVERMNDVFILLARLN